MFAGGGVRSRWAGSCGGIFQSQEHGCGLKGHVDMLMVIGVTGMEKGRKRRGDGVD